MIFWKRMNWFWYKLAQVVRHETVNCRSHKLPFSMTLSDWNFKVTINVSYAYSGRPLVCRIERRYFLWPWRPLTQVSLGDVIIWHQNMSEKWLAWTGAIHTFYSRMSFRIDMFMGMGTIWFSQISWDSHGDESDNEYIVEWEWEWE